ncbi:hypothetical protein C0Z20_04405 [Trinickia symbiotica]|uniref:Uncharacterized protein n=1 Tax=Trinickia symbiotica TaxID=863227 RepID=A0A2N7X8X3_9BURK|nr:hypothetical protein C0Z20_04405 [Trinickia symbiotica]
MTIIEGASREQILRNPVICHDQRFRDHISMDLRIQTKTIRFSMADVRQPSVVLLCVSYD